MKQNVSSCTCRDQDAVSSETKDLLEVEMSENVPSVFPNISLVSRKLSIKCLMNYRQELSANKIK